MWPFKKSNKKPEKILVKRDVGRALVKVINEHKKEIIIEFKGQYRSQDECRYDKVGYRLLDSDLPFYMRDLTLSALLLDIDNVYHFDFKPKEAHVILLESYIVEVSIDQ